MQRSLVAPSDAHEVHLRRLLDQRAAKSDLNDSSLADTPLYGGSAFSPHSIHFPSTESSHKPLDTRSFHPYSTKSPSAKDLLNDPAASSLDLEDDNSPTLDTAHPFSNDLNYLEEEDFGSDVDLDPRLSMLGPKMRFHSRAPWETGGDPLSEEGDSEDDRGTIASSIRGRGRLGKGEGIMKGLGLGSSHPRSSSASRPSVDSGRSQGRQKQSFDSSFSQAATQHTAFQ